MRVWITEYGEIKLPKDFPFHVIRKDGWWDRRFKKDLHRAQQFIEAETRKLEARCESKCEI
jgi:hypothetical protein